MHFQFSFIAKQVFATNCTWFPRGKRDNKSFKSKVSLYPLYYAEACNKFAGLISATLLQQHSFFRRNIAAVANCPI